MPRQAPDPTPPPRERLLDSVLAHVAERGIAGTSLRELADAIGTSHRMLIHHFGSKEGLLVEIVRTVEQQQRQALAAFRDEGGTAAEVGDRLWERLVEPVLAPFERLFFEVYGQALQGRSWAQPLLDGVVDDWIEPVAELLEADGVPAEAARADARLGLAVTRGLLLDLLATGDREGVDAAMERFRQMYP